MRDLEQALSTGRVAPNAANDAARNDNATGLAKVMAIAKQGTRASPQQIAAVIEQAPQDRERIMTFVHQHMGNGFAQKVIAATAHDKQRDEAGDDGQTHIVTDAGLRHLRQSGPAGVSAAKELFDNPNAYIVCKPGQHPPEGWKGHATLLYPSYHAFEHAANSGQIGKGIDAVVYDNEHWDQTPEIEKQHASEYAKKFEQLAHKLGLTFIAAPTRKFFAADARYADIVDVQLQDREAHTGSYAKALEHDAKLAKRENPDVKVTGQITSSVRHLDPTHSGRAQQQGIAKAEHDVVANAPDVDGFWGYIYQQNPASIDAGTAILKDLADDERHGDKV